MTHRRSLSGPEHRRPFEFVLALSRLERAIDIAIEVQKLCGPRSAEYERAEQFAVRQRVMVEALATEFGISFLA